MNDFVREVYVQDLDTCSNKKIFQFCIIVDSVPLC